MTRKSVKRSTFFSGGFKACLPSIILGNVRLLANEMDELTALTRSQREYRECSLMCFTESRMHRGIPDGSGQCGFHSVRADRDRATSSKQKGRGLAVLVNKQT